MVASTCLFDRVWFGVEDPSRKDNISKHMHSRTGFKCICIVFFLGGGNAVNYVMLLMGIRCIFVAFSKILFIDHE